MVRGVRFGGQNRIHINKFGSRQRVYKKDFKTKQLLDIFIEKIQLCGLDYEDFGEYIKQKDLEV